MKTESEIKIQLNDVVQYRLKLRLKKYLRRDYRNCKHNRLAVIAGGEFHYCSNGKLSSLNDGLKPCGEAKCAEQCSEYVCKHTKASIEKQMLADMRDPKLCGQREPKIAVLLWVLTEEKNSTFDKTLVGDEEHSGGTWQKLKDSFKKIFGSASK